MLDFSNPRPLTFAVILPFLTAAFLCGAPVYGHAELKPPAGDVILVLAGKIGETNVGGEAHFDRPMLEALGMETLRTKTPFEEGEQTFQGPSMAVLLKSVGATGHRIVATALDGYTVEIPMQDMFDYPVILAMVRNGAPMGVRSKGPLWIIYPLDQFPELAAEKYSARSVWQLNRLEIR